MSCKRQNRYTKDLNDEEIKNVSILIDTYKKIQNPDNITKQQIYNRIKKVIDHENWYSNEQINLIQNKSKELLFFTKKQREALTISHRMHAINLNHSISNYDQYYCDQDDGANSDEDRRWCD